MNLSSKTMHAVIAGAALASAASSQGGIPPQPHPAYTINNVEATSMDSIADLNGDGFRDLILGMPDTTPFPKVQVHSGRNGAMLASFTGAANSRFGFSVRSTGDVNGDGLEDMLVGAPDQSPSGTCYLLSYTPGGGLVVLKSWTRNAANPGTGALYGHAVTRIGDITGDGVEEIAVSDPLYSAPSTGTGYEGLVEILDPSTTPPTLLQSLVGAADWDELGNSLCVMGDVDGDGIGELAIGATQTFGPSGTAPGTLPGYAQIYSGGSLGAFTPATLFAHINGFWTHGLSGWDIASAGDVSNTGFDALTVAAPDPLDYNAGVAPTYLGQWIYAAGGGGVNYWRANLDPDFFSGTTGCRDYASSVTGLHTPGNDGDFDGDGYADILVGAPESFQVCGNLGKAWMMSGRTGAPLYSLNAPGMTFSFGAAVTELYTFNGGEHYAISDPFAGKVFVY